MNHRHPAARVLRLLTLLLLSFALTARPAMAQSILRDAETEAFFKDISTPIIIAAGLDPNNVDIVLIGDPSINAFVAGGQVVYIHSGLITAADNANQVQGVIAHELGHIAGGHMTRMGEGAKPATAITLLSLLIGAAAMAAGGGGDAGMGIIALSVVAGALHYLMQGPNRVTKKDEEEAERLAEEKT